MLRFRSLIHAVFLVRAFELTSLQHTCSVSDKPEITKMTNAPESFVLGRLTVESRKVMQEYPPRFSGKKKLIFDTICPPDKPRTSVMDFARYTSIPLPTSIKNMASPTNNIETSLNLDVFNYGPTKSLKGKPTLEWHVNFADPLLFGFYSSDLFAQDEIQVMEHPALGSLRDYLSKLAEDNKNLVPRTVSQRTSTPCLVRNVERHGRIETDPDATKGRPYGLYGNRFHSAPVDAVKKATIPLTPPTISNIIAIAAPNQGFGEYKRSEIINILTTAYTGFLAARHETERWASDEKASPACNNDGKTVAVTVHTGNWGTGAFGGNKVLMSLLQLVAAEMADLDRLVFHSPGGGDHFTEAENIWKAMRVAQQHKQEDNLSTEDFITLVEGMKFEWGFGDGN